MNLVKKLTLCLLLLLSIGPVPALAATITSGNIVNFADTEVPADSTLDTVIVVGGNATIAGKIKEDVVVVNGNAVLTSTANVRERVIVLGGTLEAEPGAMIGKGIYHIGGYYPIAASLAAAGLLVLLLGFLKILITLLVMITPVLVAWFWKAKVHALSELLAEKPGKAFAAGLLGGLAVMALSVLLIFTLIGIPAALILGVLTLAASVLGLAPVCCALGRVLPLRMAPGEQGAFVRTLYGAILLGLVFNVPFIGVIALKACLLTALGAALIGLFSKKENNARP